MADITAKMVMELRERTQVGMMDCKKALLECEGDMQKAIDFLREKGIAKAAKKAERDAKEGRVFTYIHSNAKLGVLLELDCETDFVANTEQFQTLGHELAMQIAEANPAYVSSEEVPAEVIDHEIEIAQGNIAKYYEDNCLLNQKSISDSNVKISDMIIETIAKLGENIKVKRFARFTNGRVFTYIHSNAKLGVLLELDCETDFVANTEQFQTLGHELAMQIAAANPAYISSEEVPAEIIDHEREVIKAQAREEKKPEAMLDKIADGRIAKYYEENCLLNQKSIRDSSVKINDMIIETIAKLGENIKVKRFARFTIGA